MPFPYLRGGWRFAAPYLTVVALVLLYLGYRFTYAPTNSELLAVYVVILALPWSLLAVPAGSIGLVIAIPGGLALNAWLLFRLGLGGPSQPKTHGPGSADPDTTPLNQSV